jgi:hypothetical protein
VILLKPLFIFIAIAIGILTSVTVTSVLGKELEWKSFTVTTESHEDSKSSVNIFNIQYRIFNGTGILQVPSYAFVTDIYSKTNGIFEIQIPRNFPYYNGKDGPSEREKYIVIENGYNLTSSEYAKTTSDCFFIYSIPFNMNSTITIESTDTLFLVTPLYGDKVPDYCMSKTMVPEFPFAIPVFLVSIASLIVLYQIKLR